MKIISVFLTNKFRENAMNRQININKFSVRWIQLFGELFQSDSDRLKFAFRVVLHFFASVYSVFAI